MNTITNMSARNKSAIFLGIIAVVAIVVGTVIYYQANAPQPEESISPALNVSKIRAQTATPTNKKPSPKK